METYLNQLESRCATLGVSLEDVCRAEGVANTTLARWRKNESTCREGTARALFARMDKMTSLQEAS
jgi:transcriptional antiterminator Rof (Rho-off)